MQLVAFTASTQAASFWYRRLRDCSPLLEHAEPLGRDGLERRIAFFDSPHLRFSSARYKNASHGTFSCRGPVISVSVTPS